MDDWSIKQWDQETETNDPGSKTKAENDEDGNLKINDKLLKIYVEKTTDVIERIKEIKLPEQDQQLRLISNSSFNAISLIKYIAETEKVESMKLVIFAINQYAAQVLINLKESGLIQNVTLMISSLRDDHKRTCKSVNMLNRHFDIYFVHSHAKISIIQTKENYYNVEGSGNFSFNARIEQYVIDNSKQLFDFSNEWTDTIMNSQNIRFQPMETTEINTDIKNK